MLAHRYLFGLIKPIPDQSRTGLDDLVEGKAGTGIERARLAAIAILGVALGLYHLDAGFFGAPEAWSFRSTHLDIVLVITFLMVPCCATPPASPLLRHAARAFDALCLAAAVIVGVVVYFQFPEIRDREGAPELIDLVCFPVLMLLVLEGARRTLGWVLAILAAFLVFYCYHGDLFPWLFEHRGFSHFRVTSVMYLETAGLYAVPLAVTATYVMLFLIFAGLLLRSGAGTFFTDLAFGLTGRYAGGPAKAAAWASCFMGSLSGSPVANVVSTGSITIPLMKSVGYRPAFAAAVEAVASTGGAFMPPVMGAAAFIMAEYTRTSYTDIITYALWPALLYYVSVTLIIHFEAKRQGLASQDPAVLPRPLSVLRTRGHLLLPIVVLVWYLAQGYTAAFAVTYAISAMAVLVMLRPETRMNLRDGLAALELAARIAVPTVMACAAAGLIMGAITLTGLGVKLTSFITLVAGDSLLAGLLFTMVASLIMGMGMTTTSVYVIVAILCVPALVDLGADLISAHFFVLYFGMLSNITPPVALAAYAAASIAGCSPVKASLEAFRIGFPVFLLPYGFVYLPQLLMRGTLTENLGVIAASLAATVALAWLVSLVGVFLARRRLARRVA